MKILVTGADGFLGSAICRRLASRRLDLLGISDGPGAGGAFPFRRVDLRNRLEVFEAFERFRPDLCIHLAAMAHADVGPGQEAAVRAVNVGGSLNAFDACTASGCRDVIFFSSARVLAETTDRHGIDESAEPDPSGVYARSKREVELDLLARCSSGRLRAAIVRPVAVTGPGDRNGNYARLIRMVRRGFFPLLDGGEAMRSVAFVDRIAERVDRMVEKGLVSGRTYVFSDGACAVRAIVDAIRSATGYAFCPAVPSAPLRAAGPLADRLVGRIRPGSAPFRNSLMRLAGSFVIRTRWFEEDYGPLPETDLQEEIRKACLKA